MLLSWCQLWVLLVSSEQQQPMPTTEDIEESEVESKLKSNPLYQIDTSKVDEALHVLELGDGRHYEIDGEN